MSEQQRSADGLWDASTSMEQAAREVLSPQLNHLRSFVRVAYEIAVMAPTLPPQDAARKDALEIRLAALFLKKAVTDLRTLWLVLENGYTSQAACIAAALWENTLAVGAVASDAISAQTMYASEGGELPWKPFQLAKLHAERKRELSQRTKAPMDDAATDKYWRQIYATYVWLCQIKHPTLASAFHDAFSAQADASTFVVMAAPDVRPSDRGAKSTIVISSCSRVTDAALDFARIAGADEASDQYRAFFHRFDEARSRMLEAMTVEKDTQLPFTIAHTKWASEYRKAFGE